MKLKIWFNAILMSLVIGKVHAIDFVIHTFSEDNQFRTEAVRDFEKFHIKDGALVDFEQFKKRPTSPLFKYYQLVSSYGYIGEKEFATEIEIVANKGVVAAMNTLADLFSLPSFYNYNPEVTIKWLEKAANEKNSSDAMIKLGAIIILGEDSHRVVEAKGWFSKAAYLGNSSGYYNLALISMRDGNINSKAVEYYEKAAEFGHTKSSYNLYAIYQNSDLDFYDLRKAEYYLRQAADAGKDEAQYFLGVSLIEQALKPNDVSEGERYLILAADQSNIDALAYLGQFFGSKIDSVKSFKKAELWMRKAADAGHKISKYNLVQLYLSYDEAIPGLKKKGVKLLQQLDEKEYKN